MHFTLMIYNYMTSALSEWGMCILSALLGNWSISLRLKATVYDGGRGSMYLCTSTTYFITFYFWLFSRFLFWVFTAQYGSTGPDLMWLPLWITTPYDHNLLFCLGSQVASAASINDCDNNNDCSKRSINHPYHGKKSKFLLLLIYNWI